MGYYCCEVLFGVYAWKDRGLIMAMIDYEKLRDFIIEYCGMLLDSGLGSAMYDMDEVEHASEEQLVKMAGELGVDLADYEVAGE